MATPAFSETVRGGVGGGAAGASLVAELVAAITTVPALDGSKSDVNVEDFTEAMELGRNNNVVSERAENTELICAETAVGTDVCQEALLSTAEALDDSTEPDETEIGVGVDTLDESARYGVDVANEKDPRVVACEEESFFNALGLIGLDEDWLIELLYEAEKTLPVFDALPTGVESTCVKPGMMEFDFGGKESELIVGWDSVACITTDVDIVKVVETGTDGRESGPMLSCDETGCTVATVDAVTIADDASIAMVVEGC
ncbi:hypothetical protein ACEQ8H_003206 [Pleosporales sp. CAS-2024a]